MATRRSKYLSLSALVVQNSALALTMRYSRLSPGPKYLSSTAVVMSELIKGITCLLLHLYKLSVGAHDPSLPSSWEATSSSFTFISHLFSDIFGVKSGFLKLLVPAILYTVQNNLQFVAATNLNAVIFQVTYQGKILTTALVATHFLGKSLSTLQWLSLFILTSGIACVQIPSPSVTAGQQGNIIIGITAVFFACLCSGFAGVYLETVLKAPGHMSEASLWLRSLQLSIACLAISLSGALAWDRVAIRQHGFYQGYHPATVLIICIQAAGGLIVALVIKYTDNILKGFATSLSIILSTIISIFLFDFVVDMYFLVGTMLVFAAVYMYSIEEPLTAERDALN